MFEIIFSSVIIPLVLKLGEKGIDLILKGVDQPIIDMFKRVIQGKSTNKELIKLIKKKKSSQSKIVENIEEFIKTDSSFDILKLSTFLTPSRELGYYKNILDSIIKVCCNLESSLVLKGFFNGVNIISYFHLTKFDSEREKTWLSDYKIIHFHNTDFELFIKPFKDSEDFDIRFDELKKMIKLSNYQRLDYETYSSFTKIDSIYPSWVKYDRAPNSYFDLSPTMKEECEIKDLKGIDLMITSLMEYLLEVSKNQDDLKGIVEKITQPNNKYT